MLTDTKLRLTRDDHVEKSSHVVVKHRSTKSFPLHTHDYFEIEIITSGNAVQNINGKEYTLERGCVTLLTPADFHSVEVPLGESITLWNISMDEMLFPEKPPEYFFKSSGICHNISDEVFEKIDLAASLLEKESVSGSHAYNLIEYILSLISDNSGSENPPYSPIREAIMYIDTHFRENPTLAQSAQRACLSTVYFGNLFKKVTGVTYVDYINTRKTECACMLMESGMSVTQACFSSGFGSMSGFLHTFKKQKGLTPEQFKRSCKNTKQNGGPYVHH